MNEVTINSIEDLHLLSKRLDFHIFRGQREDWPLKPKLLRVLESFRIELGNYRNRENNMLREFQSRIGLYASIIGKPKDLLGEYSLMQHYGAPTRLLDFSNSLYIAAYFAVEDVEHKNDSFIWCINEMIVRDKIAPRDNCSAPDGNLKESQYEKMRELAKAELSTSSDDTSGLLILQPKEKNERISRQQGLFLFSRTLAKSIEDALRQEYTWEDEINVRDVSYYDKVNSDELALKIRIRDDYRMDILQNLNQMNVNHETLFPGIEGFCRSLYFKLSVL